MRVLLDQNVAHPLVRPVQWLLRGHDVDHVDDVHWTNIKDRQLYSKAAHYDYQAILTNDSSQLFDPKICQAIKRSRLSVIFFDIRGNGLPSHAAAAGAILHSVPHIMGVLVEAKQQRIFLIKPLRDPEKAFRSLDPERDEGSPYWPGRHQYGNNKRPAGDTRV